jgi:hypothetical protein
VVRCSDASIQADGGPEEKVPKSTAVNRSGGCDSDTDTLAQCADESEIQRLSTGADLLKETDSILLHRCTNGPTLLAGLLQSKDI